MKYSYSWLKQLSGTKLNPQQLASLLMMHSFEVEKIERNLKGVVILDIDVLSNRGHDALSYIGMAREIAALEGKKIDYDYDGLKLEAKKTKRLKVEIKDKKLCSRYISAVMENIEIKESPLWLRDRLMVCGLRPVNNVVDATNYVMLEIGQPLHAFDLDKIKNKFQIANIVIRGAKEGEEIKLLDKTVKKLTSEDLVISNDKKALALAGIMGGEDSGVSADTKHIVLESANFDAGSIRKSRLRHKLKTDASDRFEKNIDPNLTEKAMVRVIELLQNIGSGSLEGVADVYPKKLKPWNVSLNLDYVKNLLGVNIPSSQIIKILRGLGMETKNKGNILIIKVPTFRLDVTAQEELIEEIGRIYGYEKIKSVAPEIQARPSRVNKERAFERKMKNILVSAGFSEVYNYSFYSQRDAVNSNLVSEKHLELENPMNPDQVLMRKSLVPNVLKNIRENLKNFKEFQIFEIGRVYYPDNTALPKEKSMLLGAVVLEKDKNIFHEAKKYLDFIFENLGIEKVFYHNHKIVEGYHQNTCWNEMRSAEIKIGNTKESVGCFGEINPIVLLNFDIRKRIAVFELDMEQLRQAEKIEKTYKPIQMFPKVSRDISTWAEKNSVEFYEVVKIIEKEGKELVLNVNLFDVFEKDKKDSFALHIEFGAQNRTLTSEEVDEAMKRIEEGLDKLGLEVRK